MPGDRGFDPLGLAKPTEYLQVCAPTPHSGAAADKLPGFASCLRIPLQHACEPGIACSCLLSSEVAMCRLTWTLLTRMLP